MVCSWSVCVGGGVKSNSGHGSVGIRPDPELLTLIVTYPSTQQ